MRKSVDKEQDWESKFDQIMRKYYFDVATEI